MTENDLITLYCIVDEFVHKFVETPAGQKALQCITADVDQDAECPLLMWSH